MSLARRRTRVSALAGLVAISLAACGDDVVQRDGSEITNAETVLEEADGVFADLVGTEVDSGTTTVSPDSRCFFLGLDDDVDEQMYCGPVRTLTGGAEDSWYALPTLSSPHPDGGLVMMLADEDPGGPMPVDAAALFRLDGAEPADISALDDPQAPEAPISDFATLVDASGSPIDANFTDLSEPYRLITPSATVTVEAEAELDVVPADIVRIAEPNDQSGPAEDEGGDSDSAPLFRPADGQQVRAWRVLVGPPPLLGAESGRTYFSSGDDAHRDVTTVFALGSGSQRLSISGTLSDDEATATVACEEIPCPDTGQSQYILLSSLSTDSSPTLIATVDGTDQHLDLDAGELSSDVSQVSYVRPDSFQQTSTSWGDASVKVADEDACLFCDEVVYRYGGSVQRVFLSPFAPKKGWAPQGEAWLMIPIADDPNSLTEVSQDPSIDWAQSWTLTVGDDTIAHDPDAAIGHTAAFLVDESFTEGTFGYLPQGSAAIGTDDRNYPIEAEDELTLDISFPE